MQSCLSFLWNIKSIIIFTKDKIIDLCFGIACEHKEQNQKYIFYAGKVKKLANKLSNLKLFFGSIKKKEHEKT